MTTHTPTPWKHDKVRSMDGAPIIVGVSHQGQTREVAKVLYHNGSEDREVDANAAFITRACNNHEELLAALKEILAGNTMQGKTNYSHADVIQEHYKIARQAIAKAEGEN